MFSTLWLKRHGQRICKKSVYFTELKTQRNINNLFFCESGLMTVSIVSRGTLLIMKFRLNTCSKIDKKSQGITFVTLIIILTGTRPKRTVTIKMNNFLSSLYWTSLWGWCSLGILLSFILFTWSNLFCRHLVIYKSSY